MVIEHIIAGNSIPHNEGAIPLTKESFDIKEPQKRSSDYSKTITIPEDNAVNQIFEHAFDVNVLFQTFDPSIKTSYQVVQDGVTLIDGYCRLVDIVNVDGKIQYKIQGTGRIGNVFESIKELYLSDIDFTDLDHIWNDLNIINSWTTTIGTGYVYPMIDYGGRTSYDNWITEDFKAAIFVKEYITRIFSAQGITISSEFFNTTLFKSLIIPFGADKIPLGNAGLLAKQFFVTREVTDQTVGSSGILILNDDSTGNNYNTSLNEYSTTTGKFTAQEVNTYSWNGVIDLTISYTQSNANTTLMMEQYRNSPSFISSYRLQLLKKIGGVTSVVDVAIINITDVAKATTVTSSFSLTHSGAFAMQAFVSEVGAEYYLFVDRVVRYSNGSSSEFPVFAYDINIGSVTTQKVQDTNYRAGDLLDMEYLTPKDVKQVDFVSAIIKRFNLYIDYDPIDDSILVIEPRDSYYTDVKVDASSKIDRSKDFTISPIGALDSNSYLFKDKEGKDEKNTEYQDAEDEVYGQYQVDIVNDFIKNETEITSIFAPTPLVSQESNDRVISSMQFGNNDGKKGSIRILYWGGSKATVKPWNLTNTSFTTYPYAGHLDNPYNPTFDLNWGVPKNLFYNFAYGGNNVVTYSNNNCYNVFWKNYIEEITSKDSKLLTCYLALRPVDYANYNFRQSYYIDGQFFRLIKVIDYDPNSKSTTKCIFLKQAKVAAFVPTTGDVLGGTGEYDTGEELPQFIGTTRPNKSGGSTNDVITFGDNIISGQRSIIVSNNITGISNSKNLFLIGSDNSDVQASDVTLINSPNTSALRDGETFINGLYVDHSLNLLLPTAVLEGMTGDLPILPTLAANEFYEITRGYIRLNGLAATTGYKIDLVSDTLGYSFAEIPAAFFNTNNNTGLMSISSVSPTILPFGEGAFLTSATNMEMPSGATTLSIQLVYRVIKI
jgi:hypothetical protein